MINTVYITNFFIRIILFIRKDKKITEKAIKLHFGHCQKPVDYYRTIRK